MHLKPGVNAFQDHTLQTLHENEEVFVDYSVFLRRTGILR